MLITRILAPAALAVAGAVAGLAPASAVSATATSTTTASIGTLACYGPNSCVGLGAYSPAQGEEYFLQTWNGASWGPAFGELPGSETYTLSALWCASASYCVAVGNTNPAAGTPAPLAVTWNGTSWSVSNPPAPAGGPGGAFLNGISCASAGFCVAVGDYTWPHAPCPPYYCRGFADTWRGGKWTIASKVPPRSARYQSYLDDVSCPSASNCVAVGGEYIPSAVGFRQDETDVAVTEIWNGRKWTVVDAPATTGGHAQLQDVSCWSVDRCIAVGYSEHVTPGEFTTALADSWNGRRWSAVKPAALGHSPALYAVSCASAKSCLAVGVGNSGENTRPIRAIGEYFNGRTWKSVPVAVPAQGGGRHSGDFLGIVKCASQADCVAIGLAGPYEGLGTQFLYPFAESWNGKTLKLLSDS